MVVKSGEALRSYLSVRNPFFSSSLLSYERMPIALPPISPPSCILTYCCTKISSILLCLSRQKKDPTPISLREIDFNSFNFSLKTFSCSVVLTLANAKMRFDIFPLKTSDVRVSIRCSFILSMMSCLMTVL